MAISQTQETIRRSESGESSVQADRGRVSAGIAKSSRGSIRMNVEFALERWEDDGGSDAPRQKKATDGHRPPACLPTLPTGYSTQVAGEFRDPSGVISYEFTRVYGPSAFAPHRTTAAWSHLDEGLSYWASSWPVVDATGGIQPAGRWLRYAHASDQMGARVTFAQFSSVSLMQGRLFALLGPVSDSAPMNAAPTLAGNRFVQVRGADFGNRFA